MKVFIVKAVSEGIFLFIFYILTSKYLIGTVHLALLLGSYAYVIYISRKQSRTIQNTIKSVFKIGMLIENIEGTNLVSGMYVNLHKKLGKTYIIRDENNIEYEIEHSKVKPLNEEIII